jgi:hypothetical protein
MTLWWRAERAEQRLVAAARDFFVAEFLIRRLIEGIMSHLRDQLAALSATSPESFVEMLSGLEDRPTAIVAASLLENFLGLVIAYKFGRFPSESEFGSLFTGYGPLATLSARIMFAYNLKIINADARHDFRIIKDIRNQFAHTYLSTAE